jgi:hypothetical protein
MDAEIGQDFAGVEAEVSRNPIAFLRSRVILRLGMDRVGKGAYRKRERKKQFRHVFPPD